jgi:ATP-dependent protease ClpP protease subunit
MDNKSFNDALTGGIYPILKIDIDGEIGAYNNTAEYISKRIEGMMQTPSCIIVEIRSTGGLIEEAIKIYDVLDNAVNSGIIVKTFCYGYVASAATVVAQAASPGERHISSESLYLIHECVVVDEEMTAEECMSMSDTLKTIDDWLVKLYGRKSKHLGEDGAMLLMKENGGRGRWLDYNEAIAFGLADEVC